MSSEIRIVGARQNNLKNLDLTIATGELVVVTGVSGSAKARWPSTPCAPRASAATWKPSPYARQVPGSHGQAAGGPHRGHPAGHRHPDQSGAQLAQLVAMTELNDHLKLLFARAPVLPGLRQAGAARHARLDLPRAGRTLGRRRDPRLVVTFPIAVPPTSPKKKSAASSSNRATPACTPRKTCRAAAAPRRTGKTTARPAEPPSCVVQDRFRFSGAERERVMEALDTALRMGAGHLAVHVMDDEGQDAGLEVQRPPALRRLRYRIPDPLPSSSRSIRRWAPANPAVASAASSASTSAW